MPIKSFRGLKVWEEAMDLVVEGYRIAQLLSRIETFGLASQIRRAAVSIPANIAEGHGREHPGDYLRHLSVASGSLMELETHFLIAKRLSFVDHKELETGLSLASEVGRMLTGLTPSLKRSVRQSNLPTPNTRNLTPDTHVR